MVPNEGAVTQLSLGICAHQAELPGRAQDVSHMEEVVRLVAQGGSDDITDWRDFIRCFL